MVVDRIEDISQRVKKRLKNGNRVLKDRARLACIISNCYFFKN